MLSFFPCYHCIEHIFPDPARLEQLPVFRQLQVHLEAKYSGRFEDGIIKFHVLKSMQGIMMDKILQRLLRGQVMFQFMNYMRFVKWYTFHTLKKCAGAMHRLMKKINAAVPPR
jgi:hypothetical protein